MREINDVKGVVTAYGIGIKQVPWRSVDTGNAVTQIAITVLKAGDSVKEHAHHVMDEHHIVPVGNGGMFVE